MKYFWGVEYCREMCVDFIQEGGVIIRRRGRRRGRRWRRHFYYKPYEIELDKFYLFDYTTGCLLLIQIYKVVAVLLIWA